LRRFRPSRQTTEGAFSRRRNAASAAGFEPVIGGFSRGRDNGESDESAAVAGADPPDWPHDLTKARCRGCAGLFILQG